MSGLVAASLSTPADVVKTRVMNQPTNTKGQGLLYKSSLDCLLKCVQQEGICALYKGFLPIWARMVCKQQISWTLGLKHQNVTQRELMRLFAGDIKTNIQNSTYCSISKEHFDTKIIFISYSYQKL